jgi:hypothetical protein
MQGIFKLPRMKYIEMTKFGKETGDKGTSSIDDL